jgi:hypothetical protein
MKEVLARLMGLEAEEQGFLIQNEICSIVCEVLVRSLGGDKAVKRGRT